MPWPSWWAPPPCCPPSAGSAPMQVWNPQDPRDLREAELTQLDSSGWWFGTCFFSIYSIGNNHPNWLIFFRGFETTNLSSFCCRIVDPMFAKIPVQISDNLIHSATLQACPLCFAIPSSWPCSLPCLALNARRSLAFWPRPLEDLEPPNPSKSRGLLSFSQNLHKLGYSPFWETNPNHIVGICWFYESHEQSSAMHPHRISPWNFCLNPHSTFQDKPR